MRRYCPDIRHPIRHPTPTTGLYLPTVATYPTRDTTVASLGVKSKGFQYLSVKINSQRTFLSANIVAGIRSKFLLCV